MTPPADPRPAALAAYADLDRLATAAGRAGLLEPHAPARERLELGLFRLVVMGEIKKGKSSFVNALLGADGLLPVDTDVATSTVYKVMYGPERRYKVFFRPDVDTGVQPPPVAVAPGEAAAYGTESGNPGNRKGVAFIGVEVPTPLLKDGLVLVDTPGVGGLYKAHREVTWAYAPNADAVFFVLDSVEAVVSRDEILFLRELTGKITKRVFFVQTKTDAAGAEQWGAWRDRNMAVLSDELGLPRDGIAYFPVSSKLKVVADRRASPRHLADSGFPAVLDFLQHRLMRDKRRHLASDLAGQLLGACKVLRADLTERQHILQAGQRAELDRVRREYEDARRAFEDWQRTRCPQELRAFSRGLADLKQRTRYEIQEVLDPTGPAVTPILEHFRGAEFDPRELNDRAASVQHDCLARASEAVGEVYRRFNSAAFELLAATLARLGEGLRPSADKALAVAAEPPAGSGTPIHVRDRLDLHFSGFEAARNVMYGGMAGGAMASIAVTVGAMLFPPAAVVAGVASLIGAGIGMYKAHEVAVARKREEALARLSGLLHDLMRKVQRHALMHFDDMAGRLDRTAEERFQAGVEERRLELEDRIRQVEAARGQSREEHQADAARLGDWVAELTRIESELAALVPTASARAAGP